MKTPVLFVSPDVEAAGKLAGIVKDLPARLSHVATLAEANRRAAGEPYGVILTEAELPDGTWRDMLRLSLRLQDGPPVVVTSTHADTRLWLDAVDAGAMDVVAKPFDRSELSRILGNALPELTTGAAA